MGFLCPQKKKNSSDSNRHLNQEDGYFIGSGKNIILHKIVVNQGIIVEFESIPVSFSSFILFSLNNQQKKINN